MHDLFYNYGEGWLWWLGPLSIVVFWGLVIVGVTILVRRMDNPRGRGKGRSETSPLETPKERLLKGEIDKKLFEEKAESQIRGRVLRPARTFRRVT